MLDDGQSQTRAADLFGVALIHPVEPFKHPVLVLGGDANARILDLNHGLMLLPGDRNGDAAAPVVVLDTVVTEIIQDIAEEPRHARNLRRISAAPQLDALLGSVGL